MSDFILTIPSYAFHYDDQFVRLDTHKVYDYDVYTFTFDTLSFIKEGTTPEKLEKH